MDERPKDARGWDVGKNCWVAVVGRPSLHGLVEEVYEDPKHGWCVRFRKTEHHSRHTYPVDKIRVRKPTDKDGRRVPCLARDDLVKHSGIRPRSNGIKRKV